MFSKIIVLSGLVAVVLSAAITEIVPIVSQESDINPDGSFQWSYQSGDGSAQGQAGRLEGNGDSQGEVIQGFAQWTDPEGGQHELKYTADADGYHPESSDIPVAPEIPAEILKSLEYNAANPVVVEKQEKQ